jgi:hypothetical protein
MANAEEDYMLKSLCSTRSDKVSSSDSPLWNALIPRWKLNAPFWGDHGESRCSNHGIE